MPDIIDLGGAPAEAECAQLGQTANFAAVNAFEVEAYRLAIVARYGLPPAGCRLAELARRTLDPACADRSRRSPA